MGTAVLSRGGLRSINRALARHALDQVFGGQPYPPQFPLLRFGALSLHLLKQPELLTLLLRAPNQNGADYTKA